MDRRETRPTAQGWTGLFTRLEKEFGNREFRKLYAQSAIFRLKKRYPAHFLLFPMPKERGKKRH